MIQGRSFFEQPVKNDKNYKNIQKATNGGGDNYTTNCLFEYTYFKENYKLIAAELNKEDADPKAIQQINFTGSLEEE